MNKLFGSQLNIILLALFLVTASAAIAANDLDSQVAIEGGIVWPSGELSSDFGEETLGLDADMGYEIGFRFRLPLTPAFSLSPGFHFVDFKNHVFVDEAESEYNTEVFCYRFTLEAMLQKSDKSSLFRPFLAVGAGLYRDRVVGYYDDPTALERNSSINTFGYSVRIGLAINGFELSCVTHRNRVETWHFFRTGSKESYRWDNLNLRLGYLLPW